MPQPVRVTTNWSPPARLVTPTASERRALTNALRRAARLTLQQAPQPLTSGAGPLVVDLTLVDDAEITRLNHDYRGLDRPTDVLSFSQQDGESCNVMNAGGAPAAELWLGDVIISIETAVRQARAQGHDLATELAFLAIHGTLHLLGYDHHRAHQRRVMWKQQEDIFETVQGKPGSARSAP